MKHLDYNLRRIHSLLGLIPLAISIPLHMHMVGNEYLTDTLGSPPIVLILIIMGVPGLLHILIGLYILRQNTGSRARRSGAIAVLQRTTAVAVLLFITIHPFLFKRACVDIRLLWPTAILFMIGILALAFHIGYGVYTFSMASGWARTPGRRRAFRMMALGYAALFAAYFLWLFGRVFFVMHGVLTGVMVR